MSRAVTDRLGDVIAACDVIERSVEDDALPEDVAYDAIRMRLVEIGEAVRTDVPYLRAAALRMRDAHGC